MLIRPAKIRGPAEGAIRADIISNGLIAELGASVSKASRGVFKLLSSRRIVEKSYSGFEGVFVVRLPGEKPFYVAERLVVQDDRGTSIISVSYNRQLAEKNLKRFMNQTSIRRL
ncbi:hypothetical protein [Roseibium aestuarii]|uniref:Uncharacterized protein n=1 Tax=Roseibium aestuarii TaxID=2600299 RepID=A0ABW4JX11_9HYPH|nr:hypothetical protein [Roseibium aestuarii]